MTVNEVSMPDSHGGRESLDRHETPRRPSNAIKSELNLFRSKR